MRHPLAGAKIHDPGTEPWVHLQAASLSVQDGDADGGGGAGFRIGYGLNRIVTLYFEADGVSVDSKAPRSSRAPGPWAMRIWGPASTSPTPFGPGFPTWTSPSGAGVPASRTSGGGEARLGDITFSGGSFSFGGGIYVYFTQTLALDVGLKFSGGDSRRWIWAPYP